MTDNEIMIVDERTLKDKLYIIRGQHVMLDFELAEIYGYETGAFNQQVKRNIEKFDQDFMFQLTKTEFENLMSQNVISSWGGRRKLPRAFTEQGVYMLMTVLNGDTAVEQSKALIRLFKRMKDYIGVKTLHHLVHARQDVQLTIISDNKLNLLKLSEYKDYLIEYPTKVIDFIKTQGRIHDRYIVLDYGTSNIKVYLCGASSKDAGKRITTITRLMDIYAFKQTVKELLTNPPLILK